MNKEKRKIMSKGKNSIELEEISPVQKRVRRVVFYFISFSIFFGLYETARLTHLVDPSLLPSLWQVWEALVVRVFDRSLFVHIYWSLRRVAIGFAIGMILAVGIGFLIGWFRWLRAILDPVLCFLRALPPIALIPLTVILLGIGEPSKMSVLVYASFFPALVVIYQALISLDPLYIRAAKCLGCDSKETFMRVILPQLVPHIITACRVSLGVCWATLVAAEMIAARRGLGAMMINAQHFFQIPPVVLGVFLIGAIALSMDNLVRYIEQKATAWQEKIG